LLAIVLFERSPLFCATPSIFGKRSVSKSIQQNRHMLQPDLIYFALKPNNGHVDLSAGFAVFSSCNIVFIWK